LAISAYFGELNGRVSMFDGSYGNWGYYIITSTSGIFGFICFVRALPKSKVLSHIGRYSIWYLGFHQWLVISLSQKLQTLLGVPTPNVPYKHYLFMFAWTIAVALCCELIVQIIIRLKKPQESSS
jgi:hypothetical protein